MKKLIFLAPLLILASFALTACEEPAGPPSSDETQRAQQEKILAQGTAEIGMPGIKNFRERRLLKDIFEMRDQADLSTYTYTYSEVTGKFSFFCNSIGFPIPYATQFTNPLKLAWLVDRSQAAAGLTLPQADPNGLFSPAAADGTWVVCKDPASAKVAPIYVEPKVTTSTFPLPGVK